MFTHFRVRIYQQRRGNYPVSLMLIWIKLALKYWIGIEHHRRGTCTLFNQLPVGSYPGDLLLTLVDRFCKKLLMLITETFYIYHVNTVNI